MNSQIDKAVQRTHQYWYEDGLVEMSFGGLCVLLGIYFLVQASLPESSTAYQILNLAFPVVIIGGGLLSGKIVKDLKSRMIFPRTGYVAYRRERGKMKWWTILFSIGVAAVVAALFVMSPASLAWMPAVSGGAIGLVLFVLGARLGLRRIQALGAGSIVSGLGISLAGIGDILGLGVYYSLFGFLLLLSGWAALRAYLRSSGVSDRADT